MILRVRKWWHPFVPFVLRRNYDHLLTENHVLRDALRESNSELRKHRVTISNLVQGAPEATKMLERVIAKRVPQ